MSNPIENKPGLLDTLHKLENQSEHYVAVRVPKNGIFSFGRKKTIVKGKEKEVRVAKVVQALRLCSRFVPIALKDAQLAEAKKAIANIAKNMKQAEYKLLSETKPTSKQVARQVFYAKLISKGE